MIPRLTRLLPLVLPLCCLLLSAGCRNEPSSAAGGGDAAGKDPAAKPGDPSPAGSPAAPATPAADKVLGGHQRGYNAVHVFVALADNANQGIAKVPAALGNGKDPKGNLYWGAMYGVKTFLAGSGHWRQVPDSQVAFAPAEPDIVLDAVLLESTAPGRKTYLLAEAYDGARMDVAMDRFFDAAAGRLARTAAFGRGRQMTIVRAGGEADLVCFVGHNGLMDKPSGPLTGMPESFPTRVGPNGPGGAVVLACKSREYFAKPLADARCPLLIATTGLMAPEAYVLDAILQAWTAGSNAPAMQQRAAEAYAKYQKCSLSAAKGLFVAAGK
jgi:hypothetical protein